MRPSHNSVVAIVRRPEGGEVQVLLMRCLPIPNRPEDEVFFKLPGGVNKTGESPADTARRELREETRLKIPKKIPLDWFDLGVKGEHTKYGFWVERSVCKGALRKEPFNDRKTRIVGFSWVTIDHALELIFPSVDSRSQYDLLLMVKFDPRLDSIQTIPVRAHR